MRKQSLGLATALALSLLACGCTHTQLRKNTIRQAGTLTDTYTQQVMDNLAMFVYDSGSLPQFSFPKAGTTEIRDTTRAEAGLNWGRLSSGLIAGSLITGPADIGADATRLALEGWTMEPIRDPHKLARMRCAYQYAVASCLGEEVVSNEYKKDDAGEYILDDKGKKQLVKGGCPGCDALLKEFHAHDNETGIDDTCVKNLSKEPWFGTGSKHDVPDDCGCIYVGHYCDQYVWVLPDYRDKLTQLTLAILDYAVFEVPETKAPKEPKTNEEVTTINTYNDKGKLIQSVKTTKQVPLTEKELAVEAKTLKPLEYHRPKRTIDPSSLNLRELQQQLQLIQ
jgi:hypothetical protein